MNAPLFLYKKLYLQVFIFRRVDVLLTKEPGTDNAVFRAKI